MKEHLELKNRSVVAQNPIASSTNNSSTESAPKKVSANTNNSLTVASYDAMWFGMKIDSSKIKFLPTQMLSYTKVDYRYLLILALLWVIMTLFNVIFGGMYTPSLLDSFSVYKDDKPLVVYWVCLGLEAISFGLLFYSTWAVIRNRKLAEEIEVEIRKQNLLISAEYLERLKKRRGRCKSFYGNIIGAILGANFFAIFSNGFTGVNTKEISIISLLLYLIFGATFTAMNNVKRNHLILIQVVKMHINVMFVPLKSLKADISDVKWKTAIADGAKHFSSKVLRFYQASLQIEVSFALFFLWNAIQVPIVFSSNIAKNALEKAGLGFYQYPISFLLPEIVFIGTAVSLWISMEVSSWCDQYMEKLNKRRFLPDFDYTKHESRLVHLETALRQINGGQGMGGMTFGFVIKRKLIITVGSLIVTFYSFFIKPNYFPDQQLTLLEQIKTILSTNNTCFNVSL